MTETEKYVLLEPNALLIAKSTPVPYVINTLYEMLDGANRQRHSRIDTPAPVMEFAGRTCYEAYKCKSEKTDSHDGYLKNILRQNHGSVLEHSSFTFYLSGISRADSHEIVRHRHLSFSQKSQRYVLEKQPYEISVHPTIAATSSDLNEYADVISEQFVRAQAEYEYLRGEGHNHKQAAEAARQFLPNAASVDMVVTGNARSWVEFISKRDHPAADASIRVVAKQIYEILKEELPEIFDEEARKIWDYQASQGEVQSK